MILAVAVVSAGFAASPFVPSPGPPAATRISTATAALLGMAPAAFADEATEEFNRIKKDADATFDANSPEYSVLQSPQINEQAPMRYSDFLGEAKKRLDQGDIGSVFRLLDDTIDESIDRTTNFSENDEPPWLAIGAVFFFAAFIANLIAFFSPIFGYFIEQVMGKTQQTGPSEDEQVALQLRRKLAPRTVDGDVDLTLPPREDGSTPELEPLADQYVEEKKETDASGKKKRPPVPYIPPAEPEETPAWMRKSA